MATYADLKAAIIADTDRQDLLDESAATLDRHIAAACEYYADQRFWFNQIVTTATTTADSATLAIPAALRIVDRVAGPNYDLTPVTLEQIPDRGTWATSGSLSSYAYLDGAFQFFPVPDAAYALTVYGLKQIDAPTEDADSNAWTNEAKDLIAARTRFTLYRDVFRDAEGAQMAVGAVQEALAKLRRETDRRLRTRPFAQLVTPAGRPVRSYVTDRW